MARLVVRNCSVLVVPVEGECRVDEFQDILIEDGVIAEVMPTGAIAAETGLEEIDATGLIAVPGLGELAYPQPDGDDAGRGRGRLDR